MALTDPPRHIKRNSIVSTVGMLGLIAAIVVSVYLAGSMTSKAVAANIELVKSTNELNQVKSQHDDLVRQNKDLTETNQTLAATKAQLLADIKTANANLAIAQTNPISSAQIEQAITNDPKLAAQSCRVYMQVATDGQRQALGPFTDALRANGFLVPPTEVVDARHQVRESQVRYYWEKDKDSVMRVIALARTCSLDLKPAFLNNSALRSHSRAGQIEVWIAPGVLGSRPESPG